MITSHELLEFISTCTETEVTLDAQGDVLTQSGAVLEGRALSEAIKALAGLAIAERDQVLQSRSLELHHENKTDAEPGGKRNVNQGYM